MLFFAHVSLKYMDFFRDLLHCRHTFMEILLGFFSQLYISQYFRMTVFKKDTGKRLINPFQNVRVDIPGKANEVYSYYIELR